MTQNDNQNRKRPILRLTALLVALAILSTAIITQFDTISRIAAVFAEEDPLARIYSILQDEIDEPQTYEDYYQLANIAIGQGHYEEALGFLDECEALADESDNVVMADLSLRRASLYMLTQQLPEALAEADKAVKYDPLSTQALLLRAQIELAQGDYEQASRDLEAYLELAPEDAAVRQDLARIYEALGEYVKAAECYEAVYAVYPEEAAYRLEALRCRLLAGEYEAARDGFTEYIEAQEQTEVSEDDPLLATACFLRGCCSMQLADYEQATADLERSIELGYAEDDALEQLVTCAYVAEDYEGVLAYGERLLALPDAEPSLGALHQQMGAAAMSLGRYEEAVDHLTLAIEHGPELIGSHYYRGVSLLSLGRYEEAVEDFTLSIEEGYLVQFCYYNRGVCHVNLLDYDSALDDMEMTLESGDEQTLKEAATSILWQLAQYYESQKSINSEQIEAEQIVEE